MTTVRPKPCSACPYRTDVPSGVWSPEEYEKLPGYDQDSGEYVLAAFACHATPQALCNGWANVARDSIAMRIAQSRGGFPIPASDVPLFASGREACDHGMRDVENPGRAARATMAKLLQKHPRLRLEGEEDDDDAR